MKDDAESFQALRRIPLTNWYAGGHSTWREAPFGLDWRKKWMSRHKHATEISDSSRWAGPDERVNGRERRCEVRAQGGGR